MRYDPSNVARGCVADDIEGHTRLKHVLSVDTATGEVECAHLPLEVTADGNIATYRVRFKSIHPIFGGKALPQAFHCYGPLG